MMSPENGGAVSRGTAWLTFGIGLMMSGLVVLINTLWSASAHMMYETATFLVVAGLFFAFFGRRWFA